MNSKKMSKRYYVYVPSTNDYIANTPKKPPERYCACCLDQNNNLINLSTCNHTGFFDFIKSYKLELSEMSVCYSCHHMMKKIQIFKRQTEESLAFLKQVQYRPAPKSAFELQKSAINITDSRIKIEAKSAGYSPIKTDIEATVSDSEMAESAVEDYEIFIDNTHIKPEQEEVVLEKKVSVKKTNSSTPSAKQIGRDESRPTVNLQKLIGRLATRSVTSRNPVIVPVNKVGVSTFSTSTVKFKQQPRKKPRKQHVPFQHEDAYKGKIRVIMFTEEEMWNERERCRQMDSYLIKEFKCEDCIMGFDFEITLKGHMEKHTKINNKNDMECHICKSIVNGKYSYRSHMNKHYRRYECCVCGKRTVEAHTMETHYTKEHGDLGILYDCKDCGFYTMRNNEYRKHKRTCMKTKKTFECKLCNKTFATGSSLKVHLSTVHNPSAANFKCTLCDKSYKVLSRLAMHVTKSHQAGPAYCEICDKQYKSAYWLEIHRNTHANHVAEKRYECNDCGVKFRSKGSLTSHIGHIHLNLAHKCSQCSKLYKSRSALKVHVRLKHENKSLPRNKICDHCGKGFSVQNVLTCHIRTHTGERPLQCPLCPATFAHNAALYNHKKLVHEHKKRPKSQVTPERNKRASLKKTAAKKSLEA